MRLSIDCELRLVRNGRIRRLRQGGRRRDLLRAWSSHGPHVGTDAGKERPSTLIPLADGIAAELGLHDDLVACLREGEWAETGVIEHRYGTANPTNYRWMVDRWGHVAQGPRRYSVTSFIGSTLGWLLRENIVAHKSSTGTGFFSYNQAIGFWTLRPVPSETFDSSWANVAVELGHDPNDWPLLDYRCGSA